MIRLSVVKAAVKGRFPFLRKWHWKAQSRLNALKRHVLVGRPIADGGPLLEAAIAESRPYAAGKMGAIEATAIRVFLRRRLALAVGRSLPSYPVQLADALEYSAGVFPVDEQVFDHFAQIYLGAIKACDVIVAWDVPGEAEVLRAYCERSTLVGLGSLEPMWSISPWSRSLCGKRVLVISPFAASIEKQYARRRALWRNPEVLPKFELLTIRAPLAAGLVPPESSDWFEALSRMKRMMDNVGYDVVLAGAGAFSLPLVAHAKMRQRVGVHLGGALQILFGVMGGRWRDNPALKAIVNESWCCPSAEETPRTYKRMEDGCYW
jgi:hypothetical protein